MIGQCRRHYDMLLSLANNKSTLNQRLMLTLTHVYWVMGMISLDLVGSAMMLVINWSNAGPESAMLI